MTDLSANCIGWWKLNDNLATKVVLDAIGSNNGASVQNTEDIHVNSGRPPYLNGGLTFNGSSDQIIVNDDPAFDWTTKMSAFSWIKPSVLNATDKGLFGKYKSSTTEREWLFMQNSQKLKVWFGNSEGVYLSKWETNDNVITSSSVWYFVGIVFDGTLAETERCKLFVNAVEKAGTKTGTIPSLLNNETADFVMGNWDSGSGFWTGSMDNVMVFAQALNAEEIALLYNGGNGLATFDFEMCAERLTCETLLSAEAKLARCFN